jgi:hypothetical protein
MHVAVYPLGMRASLLPWLLVLLPGCPGSTITEDVGRLDDAGELDGGGTDGGGTDGGGTDGGIDAGSTDGGSDVGGDAGDPCTLSPPLSDTCTTDADCIVVIHQTDCCGNTVADGALASEAVRFEAFEYACRASYPLCECPAGPTTTDSGESSGDPDALQVACVGRGPRNVCLTYVTMRPPDGD